MYAINAAVNASLASKMSQPACSVLLISITSLLPFLALFSAVFTSFGLVKVQVAIINVRRHVLPALLPIILRRIVRLVRLGARFAQVQRVARNVQLLIHFIQTSVILLVPTQLLTLSTQLASFAISPTARLVSILLIAQLAQPITF